MLQNIIRIEMSADMGIANQLRRTLRLIEFSELLSLPIIDRCSIEVGTPDNCCERLKSFDECFIRRRHGDVDPPTAVCCGYSNGCTEIQEMLVDSLTFLPIGTARQKLGSRFRESRAFWIIIQRRRVYDECDDRATRLRRAHNKRSQTIPQTALTAMR